MATSHNPQAEQMAHESMVRNLAAQAEAIWPQEREFVASYGLAPDARVLDVGCGTGEITARLSALLPGGRVVGLDLHAAHLRIAGERRPEVPAYLRGDAFHLPFPDRTFDLVLCRHLIQAVPEPERVVAELARVACPGGRVHLLAEDYGMMHFHPTALDADEFWHRGPITFAERTGSDLRVGRKAYGLLRGAGLSDVRVEYVTIDTVRVPRETFARIWTAWRDGYAAAIARETELDLERVLAHFEDMLAALRAPEGYGVWQLPLAVGTVPATG